MLVASLSNARDLHAQDPKTPGPPPTVRRLQSQSVSQLVGPASVHSVADLERLRIPSSSSGLHSTSLFGRVTGVFLGTLGKLRVFKKLLKKVS